MLLKKGEDFERLDRVSQMLSRAENLGVDYCAFQGLDLEAAEKAVLRLGGRWGLAWDGRVAHFWIGDDEVLCGRKDLVQRLDSGGPAYNKCRGCQKKHARLVER